MTKAISALILTAFLLSIAVISCDKRNITEPRLCSKDDISGSINWYSQNDTLVFSFALNKEGDVYACIISNSGELVRLAYNGHLSAGLHSYKWDMKDNDGNLVHDGYYAFSIDIEGHEGLAWFEIKR